MAAKAKSKEEESNKEVKEVDLSVAVKNVNQWLKDYAAENDTSVTDLGYGPYKSEDVLESSVDGDEYVVVMTDFRKFRVSSAK
ncbi:MAG: hypothetical protein KDE51_04510 [Anaerolineales bacterium]|nr:hypothetical protein [Anaerolineales bacterium]